MYSIIKHWARSWSQSFGSHPTGDLVINPVVGCHYFLPGLQLLSQPKSITALWLVPNCTTWWQRHTGISSLPKATTWWCPARTRTRSPVNRKSNALTLITSSLCQTLTKFITIYTLSMTIWFIFTSEFHCFLLVHFAAISNGTALSGCIYSRNRPIRPWDRQAQCALDMCQTRQIVFCHNFTSKCRPTLVLSISHCRSKPILQSTALSVLHSRCDVGLLKKLSSTAMYVKAAPIL